MTCSTQPITKAEPNNKRIVVPNEVWVQTWLGLQKRGKGKVESAAVWGGKRDDLSEIVEAVYFLDDLVGRFQHRGYHFVPPEALAQLFAQLQRDRRVIVADIHTHPTGWVGLSALDKSHPIEFRPGLHAIVLPSYAQSTPSLSLAGVHEYEGGGKWRILTDKMKEAVFTFT